MCSAYRKWVLISRPLHKECERWAKVILEEVFDEELLDISDIRNYVAQVAPVSFNHTKFYYDTLIYQEAKKEKLSIDEYSVFVNNEQIYKPYKTDIYKNGKKEDEIFDIEYIKIVDKKKKVIAWGWYSITEMKGVIPPENIARGFRLRKGNIQIGLESALEKLQYKETRFNYHYFGEIHTFHPDLIPNARRDYFVENEVCVYLNKELKEFFHNLHTLAHDASKIRSANNKILKVETLKEEYEKIKQTGFDNKEQVDEFEEKFEKSKKEAQKAQKDLERIKNKAKDDKRVDKIFSKIVEDEKVDKTIEIDIDKPEKVVYRTDKLSKLKKNERRIIERVFKVMDNILAKELAENVKQKIEEEFK